MSILEKLSQISRSLGIVLLPLHLLDTFSTQATTLQSLLLDDLIYLLLLEQINMLLVIDLGCNQFLLNKLPIALLPGLDFSFSLLKDGVLIYKALALPLRFLLAVIVIVLSP